MTTTPAAGQFVYYSDPSALELVEAGTVWVGAGSFDDSHVPVVTLEMTGPTLHLTPSEARTLGQLLIDAIDSDDEGRSLSTSPRPGQTFPVSSPLDTLKHTTLRVVSLLDSVLDRLAGEDEDLAELLDATQDEVIAGLREHVPNLDLHKTILTYDNGAPVRILIEDGAVTHELMPRLASRTVRPDRHDSVDVLVAEAKARQAGLL